jgi:hypothetical protein
VQARLLHPRRFQRSAACALLARFSGFDTGTSLARTRSAY